MQRLRWSGALCVAVLLAGCAAERSGSRSRAAVGGTGLVDETTRARLRHQEEVQREIEAGERELRRERAEIESMRRRVDDRESPFDAGDDVYGDECSRPGAGDPCD